MVQQEKQGERHILQLSGKTPKSPLLRKLQIISSITPNTQGLDNSSDSSKEGLCLSLEQKEYWERQIDFGTAEDKNFLGEDLGNFLVVQGAAVTDFTDLGVLDGLAELGSGGVFELGGDDFGFFVEEGQDVVAVGDSSGSQVADQTLVALSGFGIVQGDESIVILSGTLSTVAAGDEGSSQDQTLEEDNSSQEAKGSSGG